MRAVFNMTYVLGILLFGALIWYFGIYAEKRKTKKVRKQLLSGEKSYLVHWTYEKEFDFAEFQASDNELRLFKKKLTNVTEVYICNDGILLGEDLYFSWNKYAKFKELKITMDEPPCILFNIEYQVGQSKNIVKFLIPIPAEKELEAVSVLDHLVGKVKYDY
jgi:hypothetical protein